MSNPLKFTYFLGAGASIEALPVVKTMPARMREVATKIRADLWEEKPNKIIQRFADDLMKLADKSQEYKTIDTYAKFLLETGKTSEYSSLKFNLSLYFTIEQLLYEKRDNRYVIFLTTLLNRGHFPDNVKIISWNYDYQLELAASVFGEKNFIKSYPKRGIEESDINKINALHLNGIAGFYSSNSISAINDFYHGYNNLKNEKNKLITRFAESSTSIPNYLSFAWETEEDHSLSDALGKAKILCKDTDILIIIGYSFPYFNRVTDNAIFEDIKTCGKLKKIYFQDPNLDGNFLKYQFDLPDSIEIVHIKNTETFHVPNEL